MRFIFCVLFIFSGLYCTSKSAALVPAVYVKWVENPENGLKINLDTAGFRFTLQFKPVEYLALREMKKTKVSGNELTQAVDSMGDLQYFTFQLGMTDGSDILKSNIESTSDFSENIEYLSFGIQQDIKLIEAGDTLPCVLNLYERNYGIGPLANIVLAFPNSQTRADKVFWFDDHRFGAGKVEITIKKEDLDKIPTLKTD